MQARHLVTRRALLKRGLAGLIAAPLRGLLGSPPTRGTTAGAFALLTEPRQHGPSFAMAAKTTSGTPSPDWMDGKFDPSVAGYPGRPSVDRGESLTIHASVPSSRFDLEIYRIGYYDGAGASLVRADRGLPGRKYPIPSPDSSTGLVAPKWPAAQTIQIEPDWPSGVYVAKLAVPDGRVGFAPFVVRAEGVASDLLYVIPLTTYQAYNNWGGKSLYDYNSDGNRRASKVTFARPYERNGGLGQFPNGDYHMVRWLDSNGYDVTYATSVDLHAKPDLLAGHRAFLTNFHDEYWSRPMRDNLRAARDAGVHLAFFGSDTGVWQVRFEDGPSGEPSGTLVCYKQAGLDPLRDSNSALLTIGWRDLNPAEPEEALVGVRSVGAWDDWNVVKPWVVKNAGHFFYEGTGLGDNDSIPGLVGYEYDQAGQPGIAPPGLTLLARSPVVDGKGRKDVADAAIYQAGSGAYVFGAGSNFYSWKLDDNDFRSVGADPRVRRMTANLLAAMGAQPGVRA